MQNKWQKMILWKNTKNEQYRWELSQFDKGYLWKLSILTEWWKTECFPLNFRNKTRISILGLLMKIIVEFLIREIWEENEIKFIQIRKDKVKLSLFANGMIFHI